jgi:hypothetical protein
MQGENCCTTMHWTPNSVYEFKSATVQPLCAAPGISAWRNSHGGEGVADWEGFLPSMIKLLGNRPQAIPELEADCDRFRAERRDGRAGGRTKQNPAAMNRNGVFYTRKYRIQLALSGVKVAAVAAGAATGRDEATGGGGAAGAGAGRYSAFLGASSPSGLSA